MCVKKDNIKCNDDYKQLDVDFFFTTADVVLMVS